uniref:Uncharacterized protein n=1 Tax=Panagrolaimus sp. PS1159 TaxID=55785 RepID=A0AC35F879_9BILA
MENSDDGQRVGLVPINYVKLLSRQSASPPTVPRNPLDETTTARSSPPANQNSLTNYENFFQTSKHN